MKTPLLLMYNLHIYTEKIILHRSDELGPQPRSLRFHSVVVFQWFSSHGKLPHYETNNAEFVASPHGAAPHYQVFFDTFVQL